MKNTTILAIGLLSLCGCNTDRQRFFSAAGIPSNEFVPGISMYLAPSDPPAAPGSPKITDLSDKGQAALISELAKMSKTVTEFRENYEDFFVGKPANVSIDNTVMNRLLVISINRGPIVGGSYRPADRISLAKIDIAPVDFSFAGYTMVASTTGSYDLDKIDIKNELSASGEINPTLSGTIKGPIDLKAGVTNTTEHTYDVTEKAPQPYVEIQPCHLSLTIGSQPNEDISGTTVVKLTLIADSYTSRYGNAFPSCSKSDSQKNIESGEIPQFDDVLTDLKLFENGKPLSAAKASVKLANQQSIQGQLHAKVKMDYVYRYVVTGGQTPVEDDDVVRYYTGTVFAKTPGEKEALGGYIAIPDSGTTQPAQFEVCTENSDVQIINDAGAPQSALFNSLYDASDFSAWLKQTQARSIGRYRLLMTEPADQKLDFYPCPKKI